jgi:hypothetical protein
MGEDASNHWQLFNGCDDSEGAATLGAAFDVDVKDPFKRSGPTHTHRRTLRVPARVCGRRRGRARNDLGAQGSVGCEHAMKANQMVAWTRDQRGELLHKFQRRHDDMSGTVPEGVFELQYHLTSTSALEPFVGNGRAGDSATQPFELIALVGATAHSSVQADAVEVGALARGR